MASVPLEWRTISLCGAGENWKAVYCCVQTVQCETQRRAPPPWLLFWFIRRTSASLLSCHGRHSGAVVKGPVFLEQAANLARPLLRHACQRNRPPSTQSTVEYCQWPVNCSTPCCPLASNPTFEDVQAPCLAALQALWTAHRSQTNATPWTSQTARFPPAKHGHVVGDGPWWA